MEDTAKFLSTLKSAVSIYQKFVTERLIHKNNKLTDKIPNMSVPYSKQLPEKPYLRTISQTVSQHWNPRYPSQRASHPRPPDFHTDLWGNSRGSSLRKFPHNFPAEIQGKWRGIFYVDISASFPCGIPGDISMWKFPSCFPQKFQNAI